MGILPLEEIVHFNRIPYLYAPMRCLGAANGSDVLLWPPIYSAAAPSALDVNASRCSGLDHVGADGLIDCADNMSYVSVHIGISRVPLMRATTMTAAAPEPNVYFLIQSFHFPFSFCIFHPFSPLIRGWWQPILYLSIALSFPVRPIHCSH